MVVMDTKKNVLKHSTKNRDAPIRKWPIIGRPIIGI